ncbi:MAG: S8 family serine peptidase [Acidobacteria bacterium]|nr:S8 family serine peptidase [Acidobacteriota bacterium]
MEENRKVDTYKGRRIVTTMVNGKPVETVEGLYSWAQVPVAPATRGMADAETRRRRSYFDLSTGVPAIGASASGALVVNPLAIHRGAVAPDDPEFHRQWGLHHIRADEAWSLWNGNAERVVVAVIDSGIPIADNARSHPDLAEERLIFGKNFHSPGSPPMDDHGHGTHVTGILSARRDNQEGIAGLWAGGRVVAYKVFNEDNIGTDQMFNNAVLEALDFAEAAGARLVINYSGEGPDTPTSKATVDQLRAEGALLVAAAGNQGTAGVGFPGGYSTVNDAVLCVGSVNASHRRASSSGVGPAVSVVAPGVDIFSTFPNYPVTVNAGGASYTSMSGTSMATPLVAALACMIWSQRPEFTAQEVAQRIRETSASLGGAHEFGSGIIDARAAMSGL